MKIEKFNRLTDTELNYLIDLHYNHWVKFNPKMLKENTIYKFKELYVTNDLPLGIVLKNDDDCIIGFCVLKKDNLKKHPEIFPWISDVMIIEQYRGKGYGRLLIKSAKNILKELGYETIYVWTDQAPDFYKKLGFTYLQEVEKNEGGFGQLFYMK